MLAKLSYQLYITTVSLKEIPKRTIDGLRTAPFGIGEIAIGLTIDAVPAMAHEITDTRPGDIAVNVLIFICGSSFVYQGISKARSSFALRKRIENHIDNHGYSDRALESTVPLYCSRQAARVACGATGHLDEYEKLCESSELLIICSKVPHL